MTTVLRSCLFVCVFACLSVCLVVCCGHDSLPAGVLRSSLVGEHEVAPNVFWVASDGQTSGLREPGDQSERWI